MRFRSFFARVLAQPRSWFRAVVGRDRLEAEMEAELNHHIEILRADLIRAGQTLVSGSSIAYRTKPYIR